MPGGVLAEVPALYQRDGVTTTAREAITRLLESLRAQVDTAERRLYELFNTLALFLQQNVEGRGSEAYDQDIRLTPALRSQPDWSSIEIAWESLAAPMGTILGDLERTINQLEMLDLGQDTTRDDLVQELKTQLQRGRELSAGLQAILIEPHSDGIYWISIARRDQEITLHSAPLHVGPALQERLFKTKDCVVLTSATLRTEDSFHFIRERLGLEDADELAVDSPFDFKTAVLLYVPKDIPEPNQPYYQKTVENAIVDICRAIGGRTLVLFTSNSQLNTTYRAVQRPLEREDIVVFAQGIDGSRRQILDSFRSTPQSVLMGTRSFWEGVDVVGQALSCLIIARLPFAVPTDPVLSTRAETFEDPFNEYYLPDAILRFRQGFGRLIRSRDDYGVVIVLDKRILTKSYGKTILRSLPPCTARMGPAATLPIVAQRWLDPANRV
jgi:Rad3-related DNA helicase